MMELDNIIYIQLIHPDYLSIYRTRTAEAWVGLGRRLHVFILQKAEHFSLLRKLVYLI